MEEIEDREREDVYRRQELDAKLMGAARYPGDVGVVHSTFRDPVEWVKDAVCPRYGDSRGKKNDKWN